MKKIKELEITCSTVYNDFCKMLPKNEGFSIVNIDATVFIKNNKYGITNQALSIIFDTFESLREYLYAEIILETMTTGCLIENNEELTKDIRAIINNFENPDVVNKNYGSIMFVDKTKFDIIDVYRKYNIM